MVKISDATHIFNLIKENDIKFIEFRFTDYKGKWLNIGHCVEGIGELELTKGISFDGSSVAAWKTINESDMLLKPQLDTVFVDPFASLPTISLICDIIDPKTNSGYDRDPRNTARLAEKYLESSGIGDVAYFGPEPEFFIFDNVRYQTKHNKSFYQIDSEEDFNNNGVDCEVDNFGHRSKAKESYFNSLPIDINKDLRTEMLETLKKVGISPLLHHHEVANSQSELGFKFSKLVSSCDNIQKFKYIVHNTAISYGKTATFMPKPLYGDNGSGMHVHQSIWKKDKPLFLGGEHDDLSEIAIYYIGGIIKHAKSINAFSNPSINSYKRLVPGFEAPVLLAYSAKNRSASIRIPYVTNQNAKRIEVRFPDPAANPYLALSAMLMAGIDGIKNKIHPGDADNRDLYNLPDEELKEIPTIARSLEEALDALDNDREYLKQGGVFNDSQIDAYIDLKKKDIEEYNQKPHPVEFEMYYSC